MAIVVRLCLKDDIVAEVTYQPGFLVDVCVADNFLSEEISFQLTHSENGSLTGRWEDALDNYFNNGLFHSKAGLFPGEMPRVGAANEHKTLFQQAAHALMRDLEPHGYEVKVEFM